MLFLFGTQSRRLSGSGTRGRRNPGFADLSRAESRSAAICGRQNCGILWLTMHLRHPSEVEGSRCVSFKVSRGSVDFARDDGMYGNAARTCSASGASLYQRSQTGRFRSGQTGQTVNLLALRLRWFESSPAHSDLPLSSTTRSGARDCKAAISAAVVFVWQPIWPPYNSCFSSLMPSMTRLSMAKRG